MSVTTSVLAGMAQRRTLVLALVVCGVLGCGGTDDEVVPAGDAAPEVAYLTTPRYEALGFPFSEAVRVGHMLYLSGQVGEVEIVPGETMLVEEG